MRNRNRKTYVVTNTIGQDIRVTLGTMTSKRTIDPTGILTAFRRPREFGLNAEEQAAFSEYKSKIESGEIVIEYP